MGVDLAVFGEETDLRMDGMEGAGEAVRDTLDLTGEATMENRAGFTKSLLRDFLVGELKASGSMFSPSSSSKISGSRWRLPMDDVALDFNGHAKLGVLGDKADNAFSNSPYSTTGSVILPFCLFLELPSACRRGVLSSPNGWRAKVAISIDKQRERW